jgi:hypothetical protein
MEIKNIYLYKTALEHDPVRVTAWSGTRYKDRSCLDNLDVSGRKQVYASCVTPAVPVAGRGMCAWVAHLLSTHSGALLPNVLIMSRIFLKEETSGWVLG